MKITRRNAIGIMAATAALEPQVAAQSADYIPIHWLENPPATDTGVSFGVPFARGEVQRSQTLTLIAPDGKSLPLQQWPLAFWPDGSIKFLGLATVASGPGPFRLAPGTPAPGGVKATANSVDTGKLQCTFGRNALIDSITIDGRVVARDGHLVCTLDGAPEFTSAVRKVTLEQSGPVRATVKIEGVHKNASREWLPFTVRLYFYSGQEAIRLVHTIVYDGDHEKDFIRGLGLSFAIPMREQLHNRHIRLSG